MKKICSIMIVLALLVVPCLADEQNTAAKLWFGTPETVYGISARYTVVTENVQALDVVFTDAVKTYSYANYTDGELRIGIASATPLDLSQAVGEVTATLSDGTKTSPQLELTSLLFNGEPATCNLVPGETAVTVSGNDLAISVPVHNDYPIDCMVMVAAYRQSGQMLGCILGNGDGESCDFVLDETLENCGDADYMQVFYLTTSYQPIIGTQKIQISEGTAQP